MNWKFCNSGALIEPVSFQRGHRALRCLKAEKQARLPSLKMTAKPS